MRSVQSLRVAPDVISPNFYPVTYGNMCDFLNYCEDMHSWIYNIYEMFNNNNEIKGCDIYNMTKIVENYLNKVKYYNL